MTLIRQAFDLHVCMQDPNGDECIAFDVYHRWSLPECRPRTLCGDAPVLRCEARFFREDFESVGFRLSYTRANFVKFGRGRRLYRFPFTGRGSGGNMCWEIIRFPRMTTPYVLNWLRRTRLFQKTEWTESFAPLWDGVRRIDYERLRCFGQREIRQSLKHQAERTGCTVEDLIELSKPQQIEA